MEDYFSIPYRVIMYDIIPFIEIDTKLLGELDLFGYFLRDRQRKIFFIFSSIKITEGEQKCVVCITRLISLRIEFSEARNKDVRIQLLKNNEFMRSLQNLVIKLNGEIDSLPICTLLSSDLFKENSFPALKNIEIMTGIGLSSAVSLLDPSKWTLSTQMWQRIERCRISVEEGSLHNVLFPNICENEGLKNVKEMYFYNCYDHKDYHLILPKIEKLRIKDSSNLRISTGTNLKKIEFSGTGNDLEIIKEAYMKRNSRIEEIDIQLFGYISSKINERPNNHWIFDHNSSFQNLRTFRFFGAHFPQSAVFPVSIENIVLRGSFNFNDKVLDSNLPNLKKLWLSYTTEFKGDLVYSWAEHVEYLNLDFLKNDDFSASNFLNNNNFSNLRTLVLCNNISGELEPGVYCKKLESLEIVDNDELSELIFQEEEFPKLVKLVLENLENFRFTNSVPWKFRTEMLKELKIVGLEEFDVDLFFGEMCFPNLASLSIGDLKNASGKGWKSIGNLRFLELHNCNTSDVLFQEQVFKNLGEIRLSYCEEFRWIGWNPLPMVWVFWCVGCSDAKKSFLDSGDKESPFLLKKHRSKDI